MMHLDKHLRFLGMTVLWMALAACGSDSLTTDGTDLGNSDIVEAGNPPSPKKRMLIGDVSPTSGSTCARVRCNQIAVFRFLLKLEKSGAFVSSITATCPPL
jgi:hypothetical protein